MSSEIRQEFEKQGYTLGDALTIGSANYQTPYMGLGIGAFVAACGGALTGSFLLLWGGMVGVGVVVVSRLDIAARPTLRLEAEGIRRGETLIPWIDIQACERVTTLRQVFIEFTFVDAKRRVQWQRSRAAPALYRHLLEDDETTPEGPVEAGEDAPVTRGDQATYRSAPSVIAPPVATSKEPPPSGWRALVRFFAGRR